MADPTAAPNSPTPRLRRRVTEILGDVRSGSSDAQDELFGSVYSELRRIARAQMRRQPNEQTLQPTALVHEAYVRLVASGDSQWANRATFFGSACRAMRLILVDAARRRGALRRGGGRKRITFRPGEHAEDGGAWEVLAVHDALERLAEIDRRGSEIVALRFFAGFDIDEAATAVGCSRSTAIRSWMRARAWLFRELGERD